MTDDADASGADADAATDADGGPSALERTDGAGVTVPAGSETDAAAGADTTADVAADDGAGDGSAGGLSALLSGVRIGQFLSVGVVGFAFDLSTSTALRELGVFPELAALVGIEVAVVVMFLLNDRVTFADDGAGGLGPTLRRLARSNVVRAGGIAVQLVVFTALYRGVAFPLAVAGVDLWFVTSRAGGIGVGMVVNYVAESVFTWRVHE